MLPQPANCRELGCPLAGVSNGFCLDYGDPTTAKHIFWLEAPGKDEISYHFDTKNPLDATELKRRQEAYPDLEPSLLRVGQPLVGKAGVLFNMWLLRAVGIKREEVFIGNTLRCLPPKHGDSHYPTGETRKKAEACCRYYDRWPKADLAVINLHPAALLREPTPLPIVVRTLEKARDFALQGYRVISLFGGKAAKVCLKYGESTQRYVGHYVWLK